MAVQARFVMAQIDLMVGDIGANIARMIDCCVHARDHLDADCIVFPELALTGYPPEDLLLRPAFLRQVEEGVQALGRRVAGIDVIFGFPERSDRGLYNAAALMRDGRVVTSYRKHILPNYSVFDEKRYFIPGERATVVEIKGIPVGLTICEDIWQPAPAQYAAAAGAALIVNLNASPFHADKRRERETVLARRAEETGLPILYVNLVGGQDELLFDGESMVIDASGRVCQRAAAMVEAMVVVDVALDAEGRAAPRPGEIAAPALDDAAIYQALVLGVRDYIEKNRFGGCVVGLSGGIDSALTLAIAADAVGPARVEAVSMPSRYTARMSIDDALAECEALGVAARVISIEPAFTAFVDSLAEEFAGLPVDTTEENIQARCRGILLMAISNKKGKIVLTTGNKSELAVGYATLYGDMAGGFAPLKDVPKTLVYRLARYRNGIQPAIPERVLERAPSAELAPDQKDEDSLPPYRLLDPILEMYIERDLSPEEIVAAGYEPATVMRVVTMVNRNEYKRRQAPPGVRISRRAFGRDRRYPITSGFIDREAEMP